MAARKGVGQDILNSSDVHNSKWSIIQTPGACLFAHLVWTILCSIGRVSYPKEKLKLWVWPPNARFRSLNKGLVDHKGLLFMAAVSVELMPTKEVGVSRVATEAGYNTPKMGTTVGSKTVESLHSVWSKRRWTSGKDASSSSTAAPRKKKEDKGGCCCGTNILGLTIGAVHVGPSKGRMGARL